MPEAFDLEQYLARGVEDIVKGILKASLSNPRESAFLARYALFSRRSAERRLQAEEKGEHIPPFLIASITTRCNLRCAGCYAWANNACGDYDAVGQLSDGEWQRVFEEAAELGVGFILLAGGEPMLRKGVLEAAGKIPGILFPVFTNATLIDSAYVERLDRYRNLIPILSIEGDEAQTDERRGAGVYRQLMQSAALLKENGILFGASVTVTRMNLQAVTSAAFLDELRERGFRAIIYVDYVPVDGGKVHLAPEEPERAYLAVRLDALRAGYGDLLFIAFPGDELSSGGCLAAGRGFFHINAFGGAEPCPFSPYSDVNVREASLREALKSRLFTLLQSGQLLTEDHAGGCVLFQHRETVQNLLNG